MVLLSRDDIQMLKKSEFAMITHFHTNDAHYFECDVEENLNVEYGGRMGKSFQSNSHTIIIFFVCIRKVFSRRHGLWKL